MKRRTFIKSTVAGAGGVAGFGLTALTASPATSNEQSEPAPAARAIPGVGRPVRVVSISFPAPMPLEEIAAHVDRAGAGGADLIILPELCRGQGPASAETLDGPTVTAMAALAHEHRTYIACPIDRSSGAERLNTIVLLDRDGKLATTYDKVFPYWGEFNVNPPAEPGHDAEVYAADFGRVGLATCFDVNFPEVWQRLADKDAELVIWPSAYSSGTSLAAHALNHHFYVVSATQTVDCQVYDITGERILDQRGSGVNVAAIMLDLDRGIYHENFNVDKRDKLLKEHPDEVAMETWLRREQWFVLRAKRPGVSARKLAGEYGLEELRTYIQRSRRQIDERRGWQYAAKVLLPDLDRDGLKALTRRARNMKSPETTG